MHDPPTIDERISTRVMGWAPGYTDTELCRWDGPGSSRLASDWRPSVNVAQAIEAIAHATRHRGGWSYDWNGANVHSVRAGHTRIEVDGGSMAAALCLAALHTVGTCR